MSHYLRHNQVDALEVDQIFYGSKVLQNTLKGGRHVYSDFDTLSQDVFFALYKIYPVTDPSSVSDAHRLLLDPLLSSPVLSKLRRRSAGSLPDSYVALKRLLDFFLEKTRGHDLIAKTEEAAADALDALRQLMSESEFSLIQAVLDHQNKPLNRSNMLSLLQDIYDFAQGKPSGQPAETPPTTETSDQADRPPSLFEEALQQLEKSYDESPGDEAIDQRLDQTETTDQSFRGGLETEMNDRFSTFLKKRYLISGEELSSDTFMSPLESTEEVTEKRVMPSDVSEEVIAQEAFAISPEQEESVAGWKRTGEHRPPLQPRELTEMTQLTNPAASLPWDQVLNDISQDIDLFNQNLNELGIRKDSLHEENFDSIIDIYRRLASPQFRQMIERIGRNKRYARRVQYQKRSRQAKPIDKVDRSQRIDDMIDDEYIYLALDVPAFETDFYERYLSDALLTTKMTDRSDKRRGPIIVCYDGSGSMSGMKIQDTRTHILTLLEIARIQQRHLVIIQFASKAEPLFIKELNPLEISARDVYDILDTFISGGTDFELPLKKALEYIRADRHRKSDILFFTDGLAGISQTFKDDFQAQKEKYQFKLFTVIMHSMTYEDYGDIGDISDEILTIEEQDIGQTHDQSYKRIYQAI